MIHLFCIASVLFLFLSPVVDATATTKPAIKPDAQKPVCTKKIPCEEPDQICLKRSDQDFATCKARAKKYTQKLCLEHAKKHCAEMLKAKKTDKLAVCMKERQKICDTAYNKAMFDCSTYYRIVRKSCITKGNRICVADKKIILDEKCQNEVKANLSKCLNKVEGETKKCLEGEDKACADVASDSTKAKACRDAYKFNCYDTQHQQNEACRRESRTANQRCDKSTCGEFVCGNTCK
jgi:hypothetical protein